MDKSFGFIQLSNYESNPNSDIHYWVGVNGDGKLLEKVLINILKDSLNLTISSAFNENLRLKELLTYYLGSNICKTILEYASNGKTFIVDNNNKGFCTANIKVENFEDILVEDYSAFNIKKFLENDFNQ